MVVQKTLRRLHVCFVRATGKRERQENSTSPTGQQLEATLRLADGIIDNDGGLESLHHAIDRLLPQQIRAT